MLVQGYAPEFEESTGLWYADIQLDGDVSYMPFLRLAVCRFQPNSLNDNMSIFRVSTVDIIQLLPDRRLTLLRHQQDPEITVTLWGRSYLESDHDLAPLVTAQVFSAEPGAQPDETHWQPVPGLPAFELRRDDGRRLWTAKASCHLRRRDARCACSSSSASSWPPRAAPARSGSSTWAPSTCEVYSPAIGALTSGDLFGPDREGLTGHRARDLLDLLLHQEQCQVGVVRTTQERADRGEADVVRREDQVVVPVRPAWVLPEVLRHHLDVAGIVVDPREASRSSAQVRLPPEHGAVGVHDELEDLGARSRWGPIPGTMSSAAAACPGTPDRRTTR